jgi:hypothetical protein
MIMPAKKAPSANDTPNSAAAPKATPSAMASTARRNSSREPVWATRCRIHGITRRPTISMTATKAMTLPSVMAKAPDAELETASGQGGGVRAAASTPATGPAAAPAPAPWPGPRRSASRRRCGRVRSRSAAAPAARAAARRSRPPTAPGRRRAPRPGSSPAASQADAEQRGEADLHDRAGDGDGLRTESRSFSEKCRPTPNISRITPISASCGPARIGHEARRERPDQHAGHQVADQRRAASSGWRWRRRRRPAPDRRRWWRSVPGRARPAQLVAGRAGRPGRRLAQHGQGLRDRAPRPAP